MLSGFAGLSLDDTLRAVRAERARRSLAEFARQAWHVHHGDQPLVWGWHMDAVCEHLEAVTRGEITRLAINVPPGMSKSLLTSVYWPAWEWVDRPSLQYIATSATDPVVLRDAVRMKEVVESEWYQQSFLPEWSWKKDQEAKSYFGNTVNGHRVSRSTGQRVTGLRGDRIIIDDPIDAEDIYSEAALTGHVRYFDETLSDRLNDSERSAIVLIMQRLHERDLSGHVLKGGGWEHLCLPAEYDPASHCRTSIGWSDPRTEAGELLEPQRLSHVALEEKRLRKGPRAYAGQYQQRPAPAEGAIFLGKWFRYWRPDTLPAEFDAVVLSWDTSWKKSRDSDYVVGQAWGMKGADRYLLDEVRAKMNLPTAMREFERMLERWQPAAVLVEYSTTGPAIVEAFQRRVPGLEAIEQQGESKLSRANAVTGTMEAGHVYFPDPNWQPWVSEVFEPELLAFPAGANDDQVDAMSQFLIWASRVDLDPWIFTA